MFNYIFEQFVYKSEVYSKQEIYKRHCTLKKMTVKTSLSTSSCKKNDIINHYVVLLIHNLVRINF